MKQDKIASREELTIRRAALEATISFLKSKNISEKSDSGKLIVDFEKELTQKILDVIPDPGSK